MIGRMSDSRKQECAGNGGAIVPPASRSAFETDFGAATICVDPNFLPTLRFATAQTFMRRVHAVLNPGGPPARNC